MSGGNMWDGRTAHFCCTVLVDFVHRHNVAGMQTLCAGIRRPDCGAAFSPASSVCVYNMCTLLSIVYSSHRTHAYNQCSNQQNTFHQQASNYSCTVSVDSLSSSSALTAVPCFGAQTAWPRTASIGLQSAGVIVSILLLLDSACALSVANIVLCQI